jgi:preprotein translocase subunit SecD
MKRLVQLSAALAGACLSLSGCSPAAPSSDSPSSPARFIIIPNDIAGIAEITTDRVPGTNREYTVHLEFTDAKAAQFRQFTRAHVRQRVQLIIGRKVIATPVIAAEIVNGQADLTFASAQEARDLIETLGKPPTLSTNEPVPTWHRHTNDLVIAP